jgi:preprotein translocase subunit SecA
MITQIIAKIFGTNNERELKRLNGIVQKINSFEKEIQALPDDAFPLRTNQLREQVQQGRHLDEILPEAFALVREAAHRKLGQRHYDVQLAGGIVLHQGKIAEMKTGEGKTLTATLPLYLNSLSGKGAHLVTVNDYLAKRDSEWMKPVYNFLGVEVACLQHSMNDEQRQEAYNTDILYATNNELGFDYLRDNMKFRLSDYVQRNLHYAIVDEVDSILIDEARTPLIISGSADESSRLYGDANQVVKRFVKDEDYTLDEKERSVYFTEVGVDKVEAGFAIKNLYAIENVNILHHAKQALKAHVIFKRDVDYVVNDDEVLIVDEFTGRILPGRRYSDGLHQALEAKEGVTIERESHTLAAITLQNYFRMYKKLAGMTGTAMTEAEEFYSIYRLPVISVPTNQSVIRNDKADLIFLTQQAKFKAIVEDVRERNEKGQPVLIGTVAIETSEMLSAVLSAHGIKHEVLNAKQHAREAEIVEHAGEAGRITIATNMAGRGTDIKLTPESRQAGGLYILGTERHESRRIDNQLRGRSGRQGDPGESRFYISLEDDLIRRFAGDSLKKNMVRFGMKEDEIIESPFVSKTIERAQEKVEKQNFEVRKHLIEYDDVLNQQRKVIYSQRRDVLEGDENLNALVRDFIGTAVETIVGQNAKKETLSHAERDAIIQEICTTTGLETKMFEKTKGTALTVEAITRDLIDRLLEEYALFRSEQENDMINQAEKWLMLETIDQAWKQHMLNLDHLKEGINLRSWGQKTPLIEYKREAFEMFKDMVQGIAREIVRHIFRINIHNLNVKELERKREQELDEISMIAAGQEEAEAPAVRDEPKVGRNETCPCGSGKKYKKCCQ